MCFRKEDQPTRQFACYSAARNKEGFPLSGLPKTPKICRAERALQYSRTARRMEISKRFWHTATTCGCRVLRRILKKKTWPLPQPKRACLSVTQRTRRNGKSEAWKRQTLQLACSEIQPTPAGPSRSRVPQQLWSFQHLTRKSSKGHVFHPGGADMAGVLICSLGFPSTSRKRCEKPVKGRDSTLFTKSVTLERLRRSASGSKRAMAVQPGVYTLMAMSRYRDALVRHAPPAEPRVYPPLVPELLTSCFDVLILPPRPFRTEKPLTQDAFQVVSVFLQKRCAYPELCRQHDGPGALLLTPRLDTQTSFAKLFADIGTQEDVRRADLAALLATGPPPPTHVTARHVQALRFDLRDTFACGWPDCTHCHCAFWIL